MLSFSTWFQKAAVLLKLLWPGSPSPKTCPIIHYIPHSLAAAKNCELASWREIRGLLLLLPPPGCKVCLLRGWWVLGRNSGRRVDGLMGWKANCRVGGLLVWYRGVGSGEELKCRDWLLDFGISSPPNLPSLDLSSWHSFQTSVQLSL